MKKATNNIINRMIERDVDEAFFVLGVNYKKKNSYKSMHNFGTFLSKYGCETSFYFKNNFEVAEELLLRAKSENESFITLKELGDLYFEQKKYESAILFYNSALKREKKYSVCYNLSLCYYLSNNYVDMKKSLEQFVNIVHFSNSELASLYEMYGFACNLVEDRKEAQKALNFLKENSSYFFNPETIKLAYLCHDYSFIFENFNKIYTEWIIEAVDYMIIYQIFQKKYFNQWEIFESWTNENIISFYSENPEIEPDFELLKAINSNVCDPNITPNINPVFSCDFY